MERIIEIHLSHLKNELHVFAMSFVLDAINSFSVIAKDFPAAHEALLKTYDREKAAYRRYDKIFISNELKKASHARDLAYRCLRDRIKTDARYASGETQSAASKLYQFLEEQGGSKITNLANDAKSGLLTGIVNLLQSEYAPIVAYLGKDYVKAVESLKSANEAYISILSDRTQNDAEHGKREMRLARLMTDSAYRALIYSVNIKSYLDHTDAYLPFIKYMNAELEHLRQQIKSKSDGAAIDILEQKD